ncbi:relaxase/mobilization nuclease domain-containing protein [Homoserinimonas sp. A520]
MFGVGAKKKKHKVAGTNRLAPGFYCDAPSVEDFVALGDELARQNSRKVKAQSYVLSFSPEEFDVDSRADLQRVGDAGFMLAKKMHPNSPCLVVVHADGKGRAAHAHIKVLNHDTGTGKALRDFRVHWQVKKANDELMVDLGMQVLEAKPKQPTDAWATRRSELPEYEQQLGDLCAEAKVEALVETLAAPSPSMEHFTALFTAACHARGVELVTDEHKVKSRNRAGKQPGDTSVGFTFKMRDTTTPKHRIRRRKASALSSEFTHDAIAAAFDATQQPVVLPSQVPVPRRSTRRAKSARLWKEQVQASLEEANAQITVESDRMISAYLREKEAAKAIDQAQMAQKAETVTHPASEQPTKAMAALEVRPANLRKHAQEAQEPSVSAPKVAEAPTDVSVGTEQQTGAELVDGTSSVLDEPGRNSRGVDPHLAAARKRQHRRDRIRSELVADDAMIEAKRSAERPTLGG